MYPCWYAKAGRRPAHPDPGLSPPSPARADAYQGSPKLVIELVIDQFRGDFLDRYRADFTTPSGFNLFLKRGAYFTDCYYQYANTMTAPGHSTIGTGAYTDGHNIALNEWWDLSRSTSHPVSSVEDEQYQIVGDHSAADIGTSPRNELASTLGDEVVLGTRGQSKLFGISLKDRAAILTSATPRTAPSGSTHASGHFVSSTYWGPQLPAWVQTFNAKRPRRPGPQGSQRQTRPLLRRSRTPPPPASPTCSTSPAPSSPPRKLGQRSTTDVLTISISSTDILGHRVGPDAPEQRAMIDSIDVDLNSFFTWLGTQVPGGMGSVWVSLTGDHGIGPTLSRRRRSPHGRGPVQRPEDHRRPRRRPERSLLARREDPLHAAERAALLHPRSTRLRRAQDLRRDSRERRRRPPPSRRRPERIPCH